MHIKRQSTVAVEIAFDGRQHGFDEIDVLEKSATLRLPVVSRLPLECRSTLEPTSQSSGFSDEKSCAFIPSLHQRAFGYLSRNNNGLRCAYTQCTGSVVTDAKNVRLLCANRILRSTSDFLRVYSAELGDLLRNE